MGSLTQLIKSDAYLVVGNSLLKKDGLTVLGGNLGGGGQLYSTLRNGFATSGYQVPTGKVFRVCAVFMHVRSFVSAVELEIGYGDTDVSLGSASAPTNPKYLAGIIAGAAGIITAGANGEYEKTFFAEIPAGKYPFFHIVQNVASYENVWVYGYEDPA